MRNFQKAVAEDLRRFGLVLVGAGVVTSTSASFTILAVAVGFVSLVSAYILLVVLGDEA